MKNAIKVLTFTSGLSLALMSISLTDTNISDEYLLKGDLYACMWWPTCRDPDEQKPGPADSSVPKPSGDKDTTKDKKDQTQLA